VTKGKNLQLRYSTQQDFHSDLIEVKFQSTAKRAQHHQTSFTGNVEGTFLRRRRRRKKKDHF